MNARNALKLLIIAQFAKIHKFAKIVTLIIIYMKILFLQLYA